MNLPIHLCDALPQCSSSQLCGHILAMVYMLAGPWILTVPSKSSPPQDFFCLKEGDVKGKAIAATETRKRRQYFLPESWWLALLTIDDCRGCRCLCTHNVHSRLTCLTTVIALNQIEVSRSLAIESRSLERYPDMFRHI